MWIVKIKSETVLLALQPFLSFLMHLFCAERIVRGIDWSRAVSHTVAMNASMSAPVWP